MAGGLEQALQGAQGLRTGGIDAVVNQLGGGVFADVVRQNLEANLNAPKAASAAPATSPAPVARPAEATSPALSASPKRKPQSASPEQIDAIIQQESRGDPNATGPVLDDGTRAQGLMQIRPSTAKQPGFGVAPLQGDILDPEINRAFGTEYFNAMLSRYNGDFRRALIAYNAGQTRADSFRGDLAVLPKETSDYVQKIEAALAVGAPLPDPGPAALDEAAVAASPAPVVGVQAQVPVEPERGLLDAIPSLAQGSQPPPAPAAPALVPQPVVRGQSIPLQWRAAVMDFLKTRNPEALKVIPKGSLPLMLQLMGQSARNPLQ